MTLRRRLAALAGALVVVTLACVATAALAAKARSRAADRERLLETSSEETLRLTSAYADMDSGQRGFIIGGSDVFLEPYVSGLAQVTALQRALLAADLETAATQAVADVVADGETWRNRADAELNVRRNQSQAVAERMVAEQVGKSRFDTLRADVARLSDQLEFDTKHERDRRERYASLLVDLLIAIPLIVLAFGAVAMWLMGRWVVVPVRSMVDAVRLITSGDLSVIVPSGGAPDVAELGASVDQMRLTISSRLHDSETARDESTRAREALEQHATLALQLRAELASELGELPSGWTAAADMVPAEGLVAGDCYDVALVSPTMLGAFVIDIAGHGAIQAIMALKCKEILRAALRMTMAPGDALNLLADQVGDMDSSFLTAFVVLVDTLTGACRYANAGHPPALLALDDRIISELLPTGPLLGAFPARWQTAFFEIEPGAKLVMYTDGLTEARNAERVFYGTERLAAMVVTLPCQEAEPVVKACLDDLHAFIPARIVDDVTMVLVCRACR